nr:RNA-directed DNA polymerase, eukaryota [Tanacetum cinerariifolium]
MVEQTWSAFAYSDNNSMLRFKKKRQELKKVIRLWINIKKSQLAGSKNSIVLELRDIDKQLSIDQVDDLERGVDDLERGVSHDEIRSAVWDCGDNKSSGPDGFTFEFFKKYCRFIGPDFCEAVEHFFKYGSFSKGCKSSFIALIPKVMDAKFVNDYRPISLIGSVYKVITKILANRLATIIAGLVSDTQSAFLADRQILDCPFILNEVLDWCKRKNKQAMFFKVNFAKAYDSVRWDFLIDVLEAFGFGSTCRAVDEGVFKGIQLHGSLSLSHLFFADDALFMGEWSDSNLRGIIYILKCFFLASGLKINIQKSQVLGVGVPRSSVESMASSLCCSIMEKKFRYLGVMVGERMSRYKAWDDVVLKLKTRLSMWKAKTLSIGGRLTLLKSVIGASPLYNMSIFKVPKGMLKVMESIRSNFFKGASSSKKKISWIAWDKVLASKKKGGRGVSSYFALNRALLLKWAWRFSSILKEVHVLKSTGFDFMSYCSKRIGDGQSTSFWLESWKGGIPFRDMFPRLFALESAKHICVAAKMSGPFNMSFRRSASDRWYCSLSSSGEFCVKEARIAIDDMTLPSHPKSTRWVKFIPIKINIFVWRARRDCLPTRHNLVHKGVVLESTSCPVCLSGVEDVHYILFRCSLAQEVLHRMCRWREMDFQHLTLFSEWEV